MNETTVLMLLLAMVALIAFAVMLVRQMATNMPSVQSGAIAALGMLDGIAAKPETQIHVKDAPADAPEFKRIYTARLDRRATITVEMRNGYAGRSKSGQLTQPNGHSVWFDPDRIADRILDPDLVPLVQRCVAEIYTLDRAFIRSKPSEFVDKGGVKWQRV